MAEQTELWVSYTNNCVHDYHDGQQWGSWERDHDFSLDRVSLTKGSTPFTVDYPVVAGDTVYVLYIRYSTGDSFGRSDGEAEILWVFKDAKTGFEALNKFEKNEKEFQITIKTDSGMNLDLYNPAAGYFEHLEDIDLKAMLVYP